MSKVGQWPPLYMSWNLIETPPSSAAANMERDAHLLRDMIPTGLPTLHLYEWCAPSLTYGFFAKPERLLNLPAVARHGLDLARRPTGGGVVFHMWDLAFSVLIPSGSSLYSQSTLDNYEWINQKVLNVVEEFLGKSVLMTLTLHDAEVQNVDRAFFCMARPTKYDLVVGSKKIAGAAQRRMRQGLLHQGTIALVFPDVNLLDEVLLSRDVCAAMRQTTFPLLDENGTLEEGREAVRNLLKRHFLSV